MTIDIHYKDKIISIDEKIYKKHGWLLGKEFFDFIDDVEGIKFTKWTGKETGHLTNIVVGLLDKGKWNQGLTYNDGEPFVCSEKTFTTYQIVSDKEIRNQKELVDLFNERLTYFRKKYHGLFLSNFLGADQKILSRRYVNLMMNSLIAHADR